MSEPVNDDSRHVETATEIITLSELIGSLFIGRSSAVHGAVLTDLVAVWLARHVMPSNPPATAKLRNDLLNAHIQAVRRLVPVNAEAMRGHYDD